MRFDIQALGSDDEMVLTVWPEAHMRRTRQQVRVWVHLVHNCVPERTKATQTKTCRNANKLKARWC